MGKIKIKCWKDVNTHDVIHVAKQNPEILNVFEGSNHTCIKNLKNGKKTAIPRHNGDLSPVVKKSLWLFLMEAGVLVWIIIYLSNKLVNLI